MPAEFTNISISPKCSTAVAKAEVIPALSVTSPVTTWLCSPSDAASATSGSRRRPRSVVLYPSAYNWRLIASPMPVPAPVTNACRLMRLRRAPAQPRCRLAGSPKSTGAAPPRPALDNPVLLQRAASNSGQQGAAAPNKPDLPVRPR